MISRSYFYGFLLFTTICHATNLHYGVASLQGTRPYQEDRALVTTLDDNYTFAGVFDGHGGSNCADYLYEHLAHTISDNLKKISAKENLPLPPETIRQVLCKSFEQVNQAFYQYDEKGRVTGSTAAIALINNNNTYIAHVGDSRVVHSDGIALTHDHTLKKKYAEKTRIFSLNNKNKDLLAIMQQMGRLVRNSGGFTRTLAITRAFGDFNFTEVGLIAEPTVCCATLQPKDFLDSNLKCITS